MKKLLSFLLLFSVLFFIYSGGRKAIINAKNSVRRLQEEQIIEGGPKYSVVEKEDDKKGIIEGVYVPYYWKSGILGDNNDYLKGYVPSIKDFMEYIKTKDAVLYGTTLSGEEVFDYRAILSDLDASNMVFADGIQNAHSYFDWDKENCVVVEKGYLEERVFVCDNWVNWTKYSKKDPLFVLTDCNIGGMSGKCLFSDYVKVYFNEKKITENRCLLLEEPDFCDWNKYIKLIKYK